MDHNLVMNECQSYANYTHVETGRLTWTVCVSWMCPAGRQKRIHTHTHTCARFRCIFESHTSAEPAKVQWGTECRPRCVLIVLASAFASTSQHCARIQPFPNARQRQQQLLLQTNKQKRHISFVCRDACCRLAVSRGSWRNAPHLAHTHMLPTHIVYMHVHVRGARARVAFTASQPTNSQVHNAHAHVIQTTRNRKTTATTTKNRPASELH